MTVITKPLTGEKKPAADQCGDPLVDAKAADVENGKGVEGDGNLNERYHYILRQRAARVSSATTLCLLITALLVMTVGLFGGLYIYKQMSYRSHSRFRGLCKIPYDDGTDNDREPILSIPLTGHRKIDNDGLSYPFGEIGDDTDMMAAGHAFFREEVELDLDEEKYAKIEVPEFKNGRMGRFIHEFDSNMTAIVDQSAMRCFIMPLDRERILPPKSMFDMMRKMYQGYYSVNTVRVRETMRIIEPPLESLDEVGAYIQKECEDKTTYRLEKSTDRIVKRSADPLPLVEFAGSGTIEYYFTNLHELDGVGA